MVRQGETLVPVDFAGRSDPAPPLQIPRQIPSNWILPLTEAAKQYGADRVEQTSLDVLGFPAVMVTSGAEAKKITDYLDNPN